MSISAAVEGSESEYENVAFSVGGICKSQGAAVVLSKAIDEVITMIFLIEKRKA
jgi:hypothetical protein